MSFAIVFKVLIKTWVESSDCVALSVIQIYRLAMNAFLNECGKSAIQCRHSDKMLIFFAFKATDVAQNRMLEAYCTMIVMYQ